MNIPSKKVALFTLLALSASTTAPIICAADEPVEPQSQAESPAPVTEEQMRKDWPHVMRMVTRMNDNLDRGEKAQRTLATVAKVTGGVICAGLLLIFLTGNN